MFHRILVGVDDSPAGRRALERAIELAGEGHGRLGLLGSAPEPPYWISASPVVPPHSRAQLRKDIEGWAQGCVEAATLIVPTEIPVTKLVAHGNPAAALLREAKTGRWDLVVVGQTPRRFRLPLRRPVGERLQDCAAPVLVVHGDPPAGTRERRATRRRSRRRRRTVPAAAKTT